MLNLNVKRKLDRNKIQRVQVWYSSADISR